jgi:hypothetical protein
MEAYPKNIIAHEFIPSPIICHGEITTDMQKILSDYQTNKSI